MIDNLRISYSYIANNRSKSLLQVNTIAFNVSEIGYN